MPRDTVRIRSIDILTPAGVKVGRRWECCRCGGIVEPQWHHCAWCGSHLEPSPIDLIGSGVEA